MSNNKLLDPRVQKTLDLMETRLGEGLTLKDAATEIGTSKGHLSKLFTKETGLSFTRYLTNQRMKKAKEMLLNSSMSVSEIADQLGFSSSQHFSATFKEQIGKSPREFKLRKNKAN